MCVFFFFGGGGVFGEVGAPKILAWHIVIFSDYFHRAVDLLGYLYMLILFFPVPG